VWRDDAPDYSVFLIVLALLGIGIVMVYSSSSVQALEDFGDSFHYLKRQAIWALLGIVAMVLCSQINYRMLHRYSRPILLVGLALLALVLIPGAGMSSHGAQRWLGVGSLGVQPSELMKLAIIIYTAAYLADKGEDIRRLVRGLGGLILALGAVFGLIMLQPDLGTAVAIAGTVAVMIIAAGARIGHLFLLGSAGVPLVFWLIFSEEYRRKRFLAFLDPQADPSGSGYHIIQSLYALGSGGLFGAGLGQSRQKFFYLPAQHTDFIFAVIGEELGFCGAALVLGLFFLLAWRGYRVALRAPDAFACYLAVGVTAMVTLQAIINIGAITATLPITGIPLPFLSCGGSSLVFTLAGIGLLLNVSRRLVP